VWGLSGHADPGQGLGASARGGDVESVPVLSRLYASAAAAGYARRQLQALRGARPCPTDNLLLQLLCAERRPRLAPFVPNVLYRQVVAP